MSLEMNKYNSASRENVKLGVFMRAIEYFERPFDYKKILDVKKTATLNKSLREGMGSLKQFPASLDMLNFVPAQLYRLPLNAEEPVKTSTTIGKSSKRPIRLETPIMICLEANWPLRAFSYSGACFDWFFSV